MESKLKALKVVDLKDILTRAGESAVKGNKPDLITKIVASSAALQVYESLYGSGKKSEVTTPAPAPLSAPSTNEETVKETKETITATTTDLSNLEVPDEQLTKPTTETTPPESSPPANETPATTENGDKPVDEKVDSKQEESVVVDEEELKRRKRAERFGIPLVTPQPASKPVPQKNRRREAKPKAKPAPQAAKGPSTAKAPLKAPTKAPTKGPAKAPARASAKAVTKASIPVEDSTKLDARAKRFGIDPKNNDKSATSATVGQKRGAPAEPVDAEELERRRKRAERFGMNAKA